MGARKPRLSHGTGTRFPNGGIHGSLSCCRRIDSRCNHCYITRARATQVLNLAYLAPDIQEHMLFLDGGQAPPAVNERDLRSIAAEVYWKEQRKLWKGF